MKIQSILLFILLGIFFTSSASAAKLDSDTHATELFETNSKPNAILINNEDYNFDFEIETLASANNATAYSWSIGTWSITLPYPIHGVVITKINIVPVPGAALLFATGLLGFVGIRLKKDA